VRRGRLSLAADIAAPGARPDAFSRRLNGPAHAPVAVALSGGGDSLALLHLARAWADRAGRNLVALTVDHGLQSAGAAWARFAAAKAAALGVEHRTLCWTGAKPATGLPAAARAARHGLLADAARNLGAGVILMGHTADDLIEAQLMREAGAATPSPRVWSPSPAWPQGRGLFVLRPLLAWRRAELRALLAGLRETWIDDPANDDPRYSRTLARRRLSAAADADVPEAVQAAEPARSALGVRQGLGGDLRLPRGALRTRDGRRLVGALALCAAGGSRPPPAEALGRLVQRLQGAETFAATLAGARIEAGPDMVRFCREPGERARGGLVAYDAPLQASVFDGRFEIVAAETGWRIAPLAGLRSQLPRAERAALRALPSAVRAALPAAISPAGGVTCAILSESGPIRAYPLGLTRLLAALGHVSDEATLWRVAKTPAVS
jgi:tRNA(Ile)-lysidine synthase